MSYDVRFIANYILERAEDQGREVSNVSINKIVYFIHEVFIVQLGRPLVEAKIEAWKYGPVFRELYLAFREFGPDKITGRATRMDFDLGEEVPVWDEIEQGDEERLEELIDMYLRIPAFTLVEMSHKVGGAWDVVYNQSGEINPGMRISDDLIKRCANST